MGTVSALPKSVPRFLTLQVRLVVPFGVQTPPVTEVAVIVVPPSCTPLQTMVAPLLMPVPVAVTVALPSGTGFGEIEVSVGPGGATFTYTVAIVFPSDPSAVMVIPFAGIVAGAV
jgi:hypothetical protein